LSKPRILDVAIDARTNWAKKHLASIRQAYAAAPFVKQYVPALEEVFTRSWDRIVDLDLAVTGLMAEWLGVRPRIERASTLGIDGGQTDRLVNICRHFGATKYLSGSAAREYLDVALFERHGIAVEWQDFAHPGLSTASRRVRAVSVRCRSDSELRRGIARGAGRSVARRVE
jgi:hypothetical protein